MFEIVVVVIRYIPQSVRNPCILYIFENIYYLRDF